MDAGAGLCLSSPKHHCFGLIEATTPHLVAPLGQGGLRSITASASLKLGVTAVAQCDPMRLSPKHHCFGLIEAPTYRSTCRRTYLRLRSITASASLKRVVRSATRGCRARLRSITASASLKLGLWQIDLVQRDESPKHHCFGLIEARSISAPIMPPASSPKHHCFGLIEASKPAGCCSPRPSSSPKHHCFGLIEACVILRFHASLARIRLRSITASASLKLAGVGRVAW